jgi:NAD-dependent SIR2 family protein deacetylase
MEIIIYTFKQNVAKNLSMAQPSSSVAKHKLLRDTKKQQDVITSNRVIMTS